MRFKFGRLAVLICVWVAPVFAQDGVVLLHGIGRSSWWFNKMETALENAGYAVLNVDYPSTQKSLEDLTNHIDPAVSKFAKNYDRVHFVTHSMGGLLARAYITKQRPENLGRVVMLSPPNRGSEVADYLKSMWWYRWVYGPAGQQLGTDQSNVAEVLGTVDYPLGVIAGTKSWDPVSSFMLLPGADDGKVTIARMKVAGMTAFVEVPATHTFILRKDKTIALTKRFLATGRFNEKY